MHKHCSVDFYGSLTVTECKLGFYFINFFHFSLNFFINHFVNTNLGVEIFFEKGGNRIRGAEF